MGYSKKYMNLSNEIIDSTKISIAVAVMNRTDRIIKCLSSWSKFDIFDDIVLVDWSTTQPILSDPDINSFILENKKIKVIRVNNEKHFNLSKSYNLAVRNTINENVLKIDIDYILINENFIDLLLELSERLDNEFFTGIDFENSFFFGMLFVKKQDFFEAGEYNELFEGWGHDDVDLYNRIQFKKKLTKFEKISSYVYHNPHDDDLRVANYEVKNKDITFEKNKNMKGKK